MSEKTIVNNNTTLASFSDAIVNLANKVAPSVIGIQSKTRGNGSGIVWSADGHIVTCSHVVKRLDEVEVVGLSDDKTFSAKVIGNDPYSDIALLKIEQTTTLKPIELNETHHQGLVVVSVENGTPAKKAGLLIGDVIVKFNKKPVNNVQDLNQLLTNEIIGKSIELSVLRGERLTEITIIPGEI